MSLLDSQNARRGRVREIDFRRPSKFARDQIRTLERAHEAFCRGASSRLSAELRAEFELAPLGTDQLPYSVVMVEEMPREALVVVIDVEPLETQICFVIENGLAQTLVNRLLGGEGQPPAGGGEGLTELEVAVARCALVSLIESLSASWLDLADVRLSLAGTESSPLGVDLVPPSEPTLLVNASAMIDGQLSIITLCLPHRSIAPILAQLSNSRYGMTDTDDEAMQAMHTAVSGVDIDVRAEVGPIDLEIADVLQLQPGDVIPLGRKAEDGAVLRVGDVSVYEVAPGRNGPFRAVQIRQGIDPDALGS